MKRTLIVFGSLKQKRFCDCNVINSKIVQHRFQYNCIYFIKFTPFNIKHVNTSTTCGLKSKKVNLFESIMNDFNDLLKKTQQSGRMNDKQSTILPKTLLQQVTLFVKTQFPSLDHKLVFKDKSMETDDNVINETKSENNSDIDMQLNSEKSDEEVIDAFMIELQSYHMNDKGEESYLSTLDIEVDKSDTSTKTKKSKKTKKKKMKKRDSLRKEKKVFPTHFVALQIQNEEILTNVKYVQDKLIEDNEVLKKCIINPVKLHITFMVMHLDSEATLIRAKSALDKAAFEIKKKDNKVMSLIVNGLDDLSKKVLFAVGKHDRLLEMAEIIKKSFEEEEIFSTDSRAFNPHITIMKLSQDTSLWKKGIKKIDPSLWEDYKDQKFGIEKMTSLQICAMKKAKDSEYYEICHVAEFADTELNE